MGPAPLLAFWGVALLLIVIPGADWAYVLGAGVRHAVVPAVGGLVIGYLLLTAIVATGVGALVASSPAGLTAVTLAGGSYLIWHGVTTLARPRTGTDPARQRAPRPGPTHVMRSFVGCGIGVSGLNPKGLLIFLAVMPQFTDPHARWPVAGQIGLLGLTFVVTCAVFYLALGALASRSLAVRPGVAHLMSRCSGIGMSLVGTLLIAEHVMY